MTIARHYVMNAAEGRDAQLETALGVLADAVRNVPGSEGVELLRDLGNERRFIFIEKWTSVEAHKDARNHLDKDVFTPVAATLDGPPEGAYLEYLKTV
jgi:quinol monooxygenase YgiN